MLRDAAAHRTASLNRLELFAVLDPTRDVKDDIAQGGSERDFDQTGAHDIAREREGFRPLAFLCADGPEPVRAVSNNVRDARQGFDIVDDGRLAPQSRHRRERWPRARLAALAFDGSHEGGLFAAHEC